MTPAERFLSRLEGVKGRNGAWTARCPAHNDKKPSLAVRETDDGRVLLHCFGGCETESVVQSVGMDMSDLFPDDAKRSQYPIEGAPAVKFYASDLIRILGFECLVVSICAGDLRRGKPLSDVDHDRLKVAQQRIEEVMHYAGL